MFSRSLQPSHLLSPAQLSTTAVPLSFHPSPNDDDVFTASHRARSHSLQQNNNTQNLNARHVLAPVTEVTEVVKDPTQTQKLEEERGEAGDLVMDDDNVRVPSPRMAEVHEHEHDSGQAHSASVDDRVNAMDVNEETDATSTDQERTLARKKSRTSLLGRALFPPTSNVNNDDRSALTNGQKRLSLPSTLSLSGRSTFSLPPPPTHSRSHSLSFNPSARTASTSSSSTSTTSLSSAPTRRSSLSSLTTSRQPISLDLTSLKSRLTSLTATNTSLSTSLSTSLIRISSLESSLLTANEKKLRYKVLNERLRCELRNRRGKEKWGLAVMDRDDREVAGEKIWVEVELSQVKCELRCERAEREELESVVSSQSSQISHLTSSRQLLLSTSTKQSNTIATLQKQLKALSTTKTQLERDLGEGEEVMLSKMVELEKERDEWKEKFEQERKGRREEEKGEKEREKDKKALEKEVKRRAKVDAELKEVKASNKVLATSLQTTEQALSKSEETLKNAREKAAKSKAAKKAASGSSPPAMQAKSRGAKAVRKGKDMREERERPKKQEKASSSFVDETIEGPEEEEEEEEEEGEEEGHEMMENDEGEDEAAHVEDEDDDDDAEDEAEVSAALTKPTARSKRPPPAPASDSAEDTEDLYRPAPPKSRSARSVVVAQPEKKTKGVLADKTTNGAKKPTTAASTGGLSAILGKRKELEKEKDRKRVAASATTAAGRSDGEDDGEVKKEKSKKRKLFGGEGKRFAWNTVENADVNTLGLPSALSPIKVAAPTTSRTSSLFAKSSTSKSGGGSGGLWGATSRAGSIFN